MKAAIEVILVYAIFTIAEILITKLFGWEYNETSTVRMFAVFYALRLIALERKQEPKP